MGCSSSKNSGDATAAAPLKSKTTDNGAGGTQQARTGKKNDPTPPQSASGEGAVNGVPASAANAKTKTKSKGKGKNKTTASPSAEPPPDESLLLGQVQVDPAELYHHLLSGLSKADDATRIPAKTDSFWLRAAALCRAHPKTATYIDPRTGGTPLHVACSLGSFHVDDPNASVAAAECVAALLEAHPGAVGRKDQFDRLPFAIVLRFSAVERADGGGGGDDGARDEEARRKARSASFRFRAESVSLFLSADRDGSTANLLGRMLYRVVESLPDDDGPPPGPTAEFVRVLVELGGVTAASSGNIVAAARAEGSASDDDGDDGDALDDDVLSLLYRRFVRQFDLSERFFEGDNSRDEVVRHRERYKNAAVNTFNVIELLLRRPKVGTPHAADGGAELDALEDLLVHNAVRVGACPPDLLRYIVETNLDAVAEVDSMGNLPLHYAAGSGTDVELSPRNPPESYSKYVIDELLYAYPDGAAVPNADGFLPISLAIDSGKKWIGGGVRSLYEAFPPGIRDANLSESHPIMNAVSFQSGISTLACDATSMATDTLQEDEDDAGTVATGVEGGGGRRRKRIHKRKINKDESHDAIMLVQRPNAPIRDVVSTMWANEEDGGVQMLGCAALGDAAKAAAAKAAAIERTPTGDDPSAAPSGIEREMMVASIASVALSGVTSVVNAMKNHPNEPAVQERACAALAAMAPADGAREVSFAASGAISTVVGAMQAHVGDPSVQAEACAALRGIVSGGDGAVGAERATVVASVSGLTAVVNALGAHHDNRDVQREACAALEALTGFSDASVPKLLKGQTEPLLRSAADNFPEDCEQTAMVVRSRLVGDS